MANTVAQSGTGNESREDDEVEPFRLLDLPPELQLRIYEFVVVTAEPINVNHWDHDVEAHEEQASMQQWYIEAGIKKRTQPALSWISKGFRQDVLKIYYTLNHFEAGDCHEDKELPKLIRWLECIGSNNRSVIRSLHIHDWNAEKVADEDGDVDDDEYDPCYDMAASGMCLMKFGAIIENVEGRKCAYKVTFPKAQGAQ